MSRRGELLFQLTHHVRCLSVDQVVRTWFPSENGKRKALELVRALQREDLIEARTAMVHPPLKLYKAVFNHRPGRETPDFHALAYRAQSRWNLPPVRTVVVSATYRAAEITGGPLPARRSIRDTELAHDLTLAEIFLANFSGRADVTWIPEDALPAKGCRRRDANTPDAVIRTPQGETVLELAGRSYSARRLAEIHLAYMDRGYELW